MNTVKERLLSVFMLVCLLVALPGHRARAMGNVIYVKWNARGLNNGLSWTHAYTDLQSALAAASDGDEIWISKGVYKPTTGSDRLATFEITHNIALYGSFAGSEPDRSLRGLPANQTFLSGDIGTADVATDNSYHVVTLSSYGNIILDGLTIIGGRADGPAYWDQNGGGLYQFQDGPHPDRSLSLTNVIFRDNSAVHAGAGLIVLEGSATLQGVNFVNNSAGTGAGMFKSTSGAATLSDVVFENNSATTTGGGLTNYAGTLTLSKATFSGNSAMNGGAINVNPEATLTVSNSTFYNNSAMNSGGAIFNYGTAIISYSTFSYNRATSIGGGIFSYMASLNLTNSIVANSPMGQDCEVQGTGSSFSGAPNLIETQYGCGTPLSTVDPNLGSLQNNGGYAPTMALRVGSPAIDAADDTTCPSQDQRAASRPQGPHCDLGAFEYAMAGPGTYDDIHPAWTYPAGTWTASTGTGPYNNTWHTSDTVGAEAQINFNGNRFTFTYLRASNRGQIDVYVDGVRIHTINANASSLLWRQTWTSPILTAGDHTVRFVHAGGGTYIDIDAIQIGAPADPIAPAAISDLGAAPGSVAGTVALSWTAVGDDGVTGTAASYLVRYSSTAINNETTWNAATPVTTGIPTPSGAGLPETMTVSGLTPGATYYFAVRAQDEVPNLSGLSNLASAAAQAITPAGPGIVDDIDPRWTYVGSWTANMATGPYNNTNHYTGTAGNEARITITGNRFTLKYVRASNRGSIDVYVDGTRIGTIAARSSTLIWQPTWDSPTFAPGTHTLRFVHAGGGTYIDIDSIQIYGPAEMMAPAAISDLAATAGTTGGAVDLSWTAVGDDDLTGTATNYLVRYSASPIDSEKTWEAAAPLTTGVPLPAQAKNPETMTVSGLVPGQIYYFAVRAQDEDGNLGGVSNLVSVAAQNPSTVPAGIYDDTDGNWTYTGPWTTYTGQGPYNNTSHSVSTVGSEAQLSFTGVKFALTYVKAGSRGLIDVYVDGKKIGTINAKSGSTAWQQVWPSPTLAAGTHIVRFVHAGGGTYIDIDKIQIFDAVGSGIYDDLDIHWIYSGTWAIYEGAGPYKSTTHYSGKVSSEAQIIFDGTAFTLTYVKAGNRGLIDVYVDGVKVVTLNAKSSDTAWQETWDSSALTAGIHVVRFVHAGGGTYIDIDAITITP